MTTRKLPTKIQGKLILESAHLQKYHFGEENLLFEEDKTHDDYSDSVSGKERDETVKDIEKDKRETDH
jgi:hypothetical protein